MASSNQKNVSEVINTVEDWLLKLQFERKCYTTNTVSKIVNHSSKDIQEDVRIFISQEIKTLVQKCIKSEEATDMQRACNVVNGCFDNFTHASDGVKYSLTELIHFIDFSIDTCLNKFLKPDTKYSPVIILELLHSLSRILILVLKLGKICNFGSLSNQNKLVLSSLTVKTGNFLIRDDILIDTKNNFAISGILIRELLIPDKNNLIEYHKKFINTIPDTLDNQNSKCHLLQFLISSAIINTWSTDIIDNNATCIYLKFFINLCENYSSETPVILNTSRTLLLLIKHDCFKQLITSSDLNNILTLIQSLLSCVFMLLEHPVACVRHSAKDFLQLLITYSSLQRLIIDSAFNLPNDKRCYFISIAALVSELGTRVLLKSNESLPKHLFTSIQDPTVVSHVAVALENMILKDSLADSDFSEWCETWIVPLLCSSVTVLPTVVGEIDKVLENAFKKYPNSVLYITEKWTHPTSKEELRCVITALKISHKQGFNFKPNFSVSAIEKDFCENKRKDGLCEKKWKTLINKKLLEHCLHLADDDIRISAFSLLIEAHSSTEVYSETDFELISYFLKYNLNNQKPTTRQKIISLMRKMLLRFSESRATLKKITKKDKNPEEKIKSSVVYQEFLDSLVEFCFSNIFVGCNFYRLNMVLSILQLCFENIKDFSFDSTKSNYYCNKLLVGLDSTYEENKELCVFLFRHLNMDFIDAAKPKAMRTLFEKAFNLLSHMEPPDVLTGSFLLQVLICVPSSKEILLTYLEENDEVDDSSYLCIRVLAESLKKQVLLAKLDLMTAATCGPMYGTLFAIRLIFKNVNLYNGDISTTEKHFLSKWSKVLNNIVETCFEMTKAVGSVVNSSSPEGHLPMDFQTDFDNFLVIDTSRESSHHSILLQTERRTLLHAVYKNFIRKFTEIEYVTKNLNFDIYESVRNLKCLLKVNALLLLKLNGSKDSEDLHIIANLNEFKKKIEDLIEKLDKTDSVVDWPATSQVLLLCSWRSIKEAALYLGDFVSKLPIETEIQLNLLTRNTISRIGEELKMLLCEIKHRGTFKHVYVGFTQLVNALWKCSDSNLSNFMRQWLEEIVNHLELPLKDQKIKLCSTRRSAGLPFLVQAIICSEIISVKSSTPPSLHVIMKSLLKITENGVTENSESKIHALNIMRGLFKHAQLGEHVASYISKALIVSVRGSRAATWSERNSSCLLFSSLIIRIFGVARSRDEISKKNRMTSRTFFQRYSELYEFLLSEMEFLHPKEKPGSIYPKPSLYLILLILGRLYPPPREDPSVALRLWECKLNRFKVSLIIPTADTVDEISKQNRSSSSQNTQCLGTQKHPGNIDISEFLPYINKSRRNPIMKIRELGARALVPLTPLDKLLTELDNRFFLLSPNSGINQNEMHGILLQIKALLTESIDVLENLPKGTSEIKKEMWIENTKWMLQLQFLIDRRICFVIPSTYIKVLHILFKNYSPLKSVISKTILSLSNLEELLSNNHSELRLNPGVFLCLEVFFYLKTDIVVNNFLSCDDLSNCQCLTEVIFLMLSSDISEVQAIPLRLLCWMMQPNGEACYEDDISTGEVFVPDLFAFRKKENSQKILDVLFRGSSIQNFLIKHLNSKNCEYFKSKVIHRLWLSTISNLVMKGFISIGQSKSSTSDSILKANFATDLLLSDDKALSSNALICFSIYLLEGLTQKISTDVTEDLKILSKTLKEFSSPNADLQERLAVAKILNHCFDNIVVTDLINGLEFSTNASPISNFFRISIWTIPIKLLLDEDIIVRQMASNFVHKMQSYIMKTLPLNGCLINMELNWCGSPLVSLKAEEFLIDSYINLLKEANLFHLIPHMIIMALSSLCETQVSESYSTDEFGVFEKGNPNPYCEELAITNLMCSKFIELRKIIDLDSILLTSLDEYVASALTSSFQLKNCKPKSLMEFIKAVFKTELILEDNLFSLPGMQIKTLKDALNVQ